MELITLPGPSLKVYLGLLAAQHQPGRRSHSALSRTVRLSRTTVLRALHALQQDGWLAGGPGAWQVSPAPLAALLEAAERPSSDPPKPAPAGPWTGATRNASAGARPPSSALVDGVLLEEEAV